MSILTPYYKLNNNWSNFFNELELDDLLEF